MSLCVVSGILSCESSSVLKSFCKKYRTVGIKLSWVMYLFMRETEKLYLWKSLNLLWHLPVLTLLILVLTPGSSVCFLGPDETEHCYFSSLFIFLHRSSRLPLGGGIRYDVSHDTASHLVFGHFTLAKPETFFPFLGGGCCSHRLQSWLGRVPQPQQQSAPAPFPWGLCVVMHHPAAPVFSEGNLGHVPFSYC